MRVVKIDVQSFGSNCYLILSEAEGIVVDPAVSLSAITSAAASYGVTLEGILLTHGHFDHMLSMDLLRETFHIPVMIHESDAHLLTDGKKNGFYQFYGQERVFGAADRTFSDGDTISVGDEHVSVIHTPGHTGGSCCFLCGNALITGDTLFADNVGRWDLPTGDVNELRESLQKLRTLDPTLRIRPGHGIGEKLGEALDFAEHLI